MATEAEILGKFETSGWISQCALLISNTFSRTEETFGKHETE